MSIHPKYDQASAETNNAQMASSKERATGEGGVTRISIAAGRTSRSVAVSRGARAAEEPGMGITETGRVGSVAMALVITLLCLNPPKPAIDASRAGQKFVVRAFFHDRSILDRDDAIAIAHGR